MVAAATATLAGSSAALATATLGALDLLTGVLCAVVASAAAVVVSRRVPRSGPRPRDVTVAAVLAVGIAVSAGVWASWDSSEHLLVDRDPGSYATTAKWMSSGNSMRVSDPLAAFGSTPDVAADSNAVFPVGDDLEFQFMHLPAALPALAGVLLGDHALLVVNGVVAALGLMAIYSLTVRVTSRPVLSLLAPASLAVSMPFVAVARDVYSEPFVLLFLWTALMLMSEVARYPQRRDLAGLAGVFIGATVAARVDSVPNLVFGVVVATAWVLCADEDSTDQRIRAARAGLRAGAVVALLGTLDLLVWSRNYASMLRTNLIMLWALLAVVAIGCWSVYRNRVTVGRFAQRAARHGSMLATTGAVAVGVALLSSWALRAHLQVVRAAEPMWFRLAEWQSAEGQAADATRTYAESSMAWMGWYLGVPALLFAILTLIWASRRILLGRAAPELVMVTLLVLGTGAMYWWRPSILPDQIWATRRFVPVVIPGLTVMACIGVAALSDRLVPGYRRGAATSLAGAALLLPALMVTLNAPLMSEQEGMLGVIEEACELLEHDAAVLVVGHLDRRVLPQTLRSWCDLPVAVMDDEENPPNARTLASIAEHTADNGYRLMVLSSDPGALAEVRLGDPDAHTTRQASSERRLEHTLTRAPSRYLDADETVTVPAHYSLTIVEIPER